MDLAKNLAKDPDQTPIQKAKLVPSHGLTGSQERVHNKKEPDLAKISTKTYKKNNLASNVARDDTGENEKKAEAKTEAKKKAWWLPKI